MKRPWSRSRPSEDIGMTAMIDVVFLLLVFFLWTSRFDEPERDLLAGMSMSEAVASAGSKPRPVETPPDQVPELVDELIIRIEGQGTSRRWLVGEAGVNRIEALRQRLQQIARIGVQPPVIIEPAADIAMDDVIDTFDLTRQLGFRRVYLGVDP